MEVTIKGYNRVANKLRKFVAANPEPANKIVREWVKWLRRKLKATKYPPKRPAQVYVRTGRLANSWRARDNTIVNSAPYAVYVVNRGTQARVHAGRWWTAQDIIDRYKADLTSKLTKAYKREWESQTH